MREGFSLRSMKNCSSIYGREWVNMFLVFVKPRKSFSDLSKSTKRRRKASLTSILSALQITTAETLSITAELWHKLRQHLKLLLLIQFSQILELDHLSTSLKLSHCFFLETFWIAKKCSGGFFLEVSNHYDSFLMPEEQFLNTCPICLNCVQNLILGSH